MRAPLAPKKEQLHAMQSSYSHLSPSVSLRKLCSGLFANRALLRQMIRRDIASRYKGSVLGFAWSFFTPVLMLAVYTLVFSEILGSRWNTGSTGANNEQFAIILFAGLIVLNIFAEVLNKAPTLILSNSNYVKKVVFPLEILPLIPIATVLFHALINIAILEIALLLVSGSVFWTFLLIPLVLLPFVLLTAGIAWFLASVGVYLRDVGQSIGMLTTALMFLSPVFYPIASVPENFRPLLMANPLTFIIEQSRGVLIWGIPPDWFGLGIYFLISVLVAWFGFAWFQKTRRGFADVI